MIGRKGRLVAALAALSLAATARAQEPEALHHPMIKPYPGSTIPGGDSNFVVHAFDEFELPLGPIKRDEQGQSKPVKSQHLEGKWTTVPYFNPEGRSVLEVYKNYEQALAGAGFKTLYSCANADCGDGSSDSGAHPPFADPTYLRRYLAAELERPEGDVYAVVSVSAQNSGSQASTEINVVEVKPMQGKMVTVDAAALDEGLKRTGHVAVYGILFDTDSDAVKPKSDPVLQQIAKLLAQEKTLKLYVVGHTDNQGAFDHNMNLSQNRAAAVMRALTERYKVSPARLKSAGVGPLSPVASNGSDEGRARNRRVELVEQ